MRTWTIFAGHDVGRTAPHLPVDMTIKVARLERLCSWLVKRAEVCTVSDALTARTQRPLVSLTFDDGYRGLVRIAAPLLRKLGLRATVYLHTGTFEGAWIPWTDLFFRLHQELGTSELCSACERFAGFEGDSLRVRHAKPNAYQLKAHLKERYGDAELEDLLGELYRSRVGDPLEFVRECYLRPEDLEEVSDVFEFGAHTVKHRRLARLDETSALHEMTASKEHLERILGRPVTSFAFPFGRSADLPEKAVKWVERAGFDVGLSMLEGTNLLPPASAHLLKRWPLQDDWSALDLECLIAGKLEKRWLRP